MATVEARLTVNTRPWDLGGKSVYVKDATLAQISGRSADLAFLTILAKNQVDSKFVPLTDVTPAISSAYLNCGDNGGNIAAYQAVSDGEFAVTVDGVLINITGLVFTAATALTDIADIINVAAAGRFIVRFDERDSANGTFTLQSPTLGLPQSTITALSAVSGGSGTDISGSSFLNGTGATPTSATGDIGTRRPAGIYMQEDLLAATLAAADVTNQPVLTKGKPKFIDEDMLVLENSLTLDTQIPGEGMTIREYLTNILDIIPRPSVNAQQTQPIA